MKGVKLLHIFFLVLFSANFALLAGFFCYWCYYPHWSRDSLSPVCRIFLLICPFVSLVLFTFFYTLKKSTIWFCSNFFPKYMQRLCMNKEPFMFHNVIFNKISVSTLKILTKCKESVFKVCVEDLRRQKRSKLFKL